MGGELQERGASFVEACLTEALLHAVPRALGLPREEVERAVASMKLKVARTPDRSLGDYAAPLHYVLKASGQAPSSWAAAGARVAEEVMSSPFREKCHISKVEFVNGYLNFWIDFAGLSEAVFSYFLGGGVGELKRVGGGRRVVVEHTSANPVHPLHVGSGRNSVLGDTFARLLAKLGFEVNRRFYVNDMGRQVAVLAYGVSILEAAGVRRDESLKPDHWYGVVYALTNLVIEQRRLLEEISRARASFFEALASLARKLRETGHEAAGELERLASARRLKHDLPSVLKRASEVLGGLAKGPLAGDAKAVAEIARDLAKKHREYVAISKQIAKLAELAPEAYAALSSGIRSYAEAAGEVKKLMKKCEEEDPATLELFRRVAAEVLEGFKQTLSSLNISFDAFDFESSREVLRGAREVVRALESSGYARREEGALLVDLDAAAEGIPKVRELFGADRPGKFIVQRSDGTTLYVTRDISYAVYKFEATGASKVYNVIATEQAREQKQVKAVLLLLGREREADNTVHFAYELVNLKGMRMSGRRGIYYTLDELLEDYSRVAERARRELGGEGGAGEASSRPLAVANARALLLSVEPMKVLSFDPKRLEEAQHGSAILYAYVRLQGILRRALGREPLDELDALAREALGGPWRGYSPSEAERELVDLLAGFPKALVSAYEEMKPNRVLEYALGLSAAVNKFYEAHRVVGEPDPAARAYRVALVASALVAMKELVDVLGFDHVRRI